MPRKKKDTDGPSTTDPVVSDLGRRGSHRSGHVSIALTIIPTEDGLQAFAVELQDVTFKKARILEPSGSPEGFGLTMERVHYAIADRTFDENQTWDSSYATGIKK